MSELVAVYGLATILLGGLGLLAVSAPRRLAARLVAVAVIAALLPTAYAALLSLMSLPKAAGFEWWHRTAREAVVLASELREDQGIYLWLRLPQVAEPRAYALPWDRRLAAQLQAAARQAEGSGESLRMRRPFQTSRDDRTPRFYAPPPSAPPLKRVLAAPALQTPRAAARP